MRLPFQHKGALWKAQGIKQLTFQAGRAIAESLAADLSAYFSSAS
jgi:hypothetical protein